MAAGDYFVEVSGIFNRWIKKTLRRPPFLFFSLVQPIVWFVLFTQAFKSIASIPNFSSYTGTGDYTTFFTAAVVIQTVIGSAMQSGLGLVTDLESGYLDKMRVAPIHRSSILVGKVLSDGFRILLQSIVILLLAYALSVRIATGILGIVAILLFAAAFGIAWSGISTFIALATKNSEATLMISIITTFPLLFLSTAMLPLGLLQDPVHGIAIYNPITYIADALHNLVIFASPDWAALGWALITILVIGGISLSATTAMFRRTVAG
jgi:ABC-2 type transport system permease protein